MFALSDRVTVLKDGRTVDTVRTRETSSDEIIERMVGRRLASMYSRTSAARGAIALETRDLSRAGALNAILDRGLPRGDRGRRRSRRCWTDRAGAGDRRC